MEIRFPKPNTKNNPAEAPKTISEFTTLKFEYVPIIRPTGAAKQFNTNAVFSFNVVAYSIYLCPSEYEIAKLLNINKLAICI